MERIRHVPVLLALLLAGCAGSKGANEPRPGASVPLSEAIRTAMPRAEGYTAVAAGVCEDDEDYYEVAFLDHGKVKRVSVDSRNGSVERVGDGGVRPGSESTAERLERLLPGARIDLARAVEVAAAGKASGARAIGVEIDEREGALVYVVTLVDGSRTRRTTIDAATGAVLHIQASGDASEAKIVPGSETRG
jgi:uncharacterized membrane protein YkoI